MGVNHVFVDVEDTPDFQQIWDSLPESYHQRVTVWKADLSESAKDSRPSDDYSTLQSRQGKTMNRAKDMCKQMGISWLIHIDDDELLYAPLHRSVGEILASMPSGFDQARMPNAEALFASSNVSSSECFTKTSMANLNIYKMASYVNGKVALRVTDDKYIPRPHGWRTETGDLEISTIHLDGQTFGSPLWVVHFESCPFNHWQDKFWELGNTSPKKVTDIPFKFYRESITRMRRCRQLRSQRKGQRKAGSKKDPTEEAWQSLESSEARKLSHNWPKFMLKNDDEDCSKAALQKFWSRWRTTQNPAIDPADLMPITIPWERIKTSAFHVSPL